MAQPIGPEDTAVVLKFGGGVHSSASEDEIDPRECAEGKNLRLDLENKEYRNRAPFDLMATAPNGGQINGFISLTKSDGTAHLAVQAGTSVYEYDGLSNFTLLDTVSSSARLRGRLEANWKLADKVIVTDMALAEVVKEWDGTTWQDVSFTDEVPAAFGNFFAKYCFVASERAVFANVKDPSSTLAHMIIGSKRGDYTNITVSQRPSSALSAEDPWFLLTPDLYPINGLVEAFGRIAISTDEGSFFNISGADATDFAISELHPRSFASGDEAVAYIGNDILFCRQGRVESLAATEKFGDVSVDDVSRPISDLVQSYKDWTIAYNARFDRVYMIPGGSQGEMWVLHKDLARQLTLTDVSQSRSQLSPWMRWTTEHPMSMNPTAIQNVIDPQDGLEYVLMGDSNGNIFRMEGSGSMGDGGSASITSEFLSKLFVFPVDTQAFNIEGHIKYRKGEAATVVITLEYAGYSVVNEAVTIDLPAISDRPVYNDGNYYGGNNAYYGSAFSGRLTRQNFSPAGQSNEFQVRVTVTGTTSVEINEIILKVTASS